MDETAPLFIAFWVCRQAQEIVDGYTIQIGKSD